MAVLPSSMPPSMRKVDTYGASARTGRLHSGSGTASIADNSTDAISQPTRRKVCNGSHVRLWHDAIALWRNIHILGMQAAGHALMHARLQHSVAVRCECATWIAHTAMAQLHATVTKTKPLPHTQQHRLAVSTSPATKMTHSAAMKLVPAVVRYGSASATSLTAQGTPSSTERA